VKNRYQGLIFALAVTVLSVSAGTASSAVLDFEDIVVPPGALGVAPLPPGYHGLDWSSTWNVSTISSGWFPISQTPSGQNYAWSSAANDLSVSGATFDFNSMWASSGFFGNTGEAIARGFVGATEVFTQSFTPTTTFQLFNFNFTDIDRLEFTDQHGNLLIDDFSVDVDIAAVPVPATIVLFGFGLLALFAMRNKLSFLP